jgi:hypothetical protein
MAITLVDSVGLLAREGREANLRPRVGALKFFAAVADISVINRSTQAPTFRTCGLLIQQEFDIAGGIERQFLHGLA